MANFYKNAFFTPTTTALEVVYTCPANSRAILQNIQVSNEAGSKKVYAYITDTSAAATIQIAYADITGPTICNLAKGPIVLEEGDVLYLSASSISDVAAVISILEMNRSDQNG